MNKKTLSLYIVIFSCFAFLSIISAQDVVKILAVGNSFSTDAAESYVDDLAIADGLQLIIANMYIGGCSLERHWKNAEGDRKSVV